MGIFDFFKKKNATESPEEFFKSCLVAFHTYAKERGYATKGLIFIPELNQVGQKPVSAYLNDDFLISRFQGNPEALNYVTTTLTLQTGFVYGNIWHVDFNEILAGADDEVIQARNRSFVEPLITENLKMTEESFSAFCKDLYMVWRKQILPHQGKKNLYAYVFEANMAIFQLGVSMILEKLGY